MTSPFDHPWLGGLFHDQAAADVWSPENQLTYMLDFEAAFSVALGATGVVTPGIANRVAGIIRGAQPSIADLRAGTGLDGVVVPALVRHLKSRVDPDDHIALHKGATSQDVIDTALALTLRAFNDVVQTRLTSLMAALSKLNDDFGTNQMMGRTRMQAALPIPASTRITTWQTPLQSHLNRLDALRPQIECLQLGGPVGDRAALGAQGDAIAAHMATALNLTNPPTAWHATRENLVDYASLLSLITGSLGKMGQDICLMAQQGVDDITLSGGGGSSAMAHKQNPVLPELLVTLAHFNATQLSGMHNALIHEQERSGSAWAVEWMILPQMAKACARSLGAAYDICGSITALGHPSDA